MIFFVFSILYQALAHYFDWRHLFRIQPPQPVFLILNYIVGCIGITLAYLGWLEGSLSQPAWLMLADSDPRAMFVLILVANGLTVMACYALDALVLGRNRAAEKREENERLQKRIAELEQELSHASGQRA